MFLSGSTSSCHQKQISGYLLRPGSAFVGIYCTSRVRHNTSGGPRSTQSWIYQGTTPPVSKKPPVGASSGARDWRTVSAAPSSTVWVPLLPFNSVAV
jgi:hypothetical protein